MIRPSWSRLHSVAQPALELELRLLLELLSVLPDPGAPLEVMVLPSNVRVGEDGSVEIGPLREGALEAQKRYLAPEASGDVSSAIYSVGALLFEAVAGVRFESPEVVQQEIVAARVAAEAAGLGTGHWELELLEVAAKATRFDPNQRWTSQTEFAAELQRVAEGHFASREELAEYATGFFGESQPPQSGNSADASSDVPASSLSAPKPTLLGMGTVEGPSLAAAEDSAAAAAEDSAAAAAEDSATAAAEDSAAAAEDSAASAAEDSSVAAPHPHQTLLGVGAPPPSANPHQTLMGMGTPAPPPDPHHTLVGVGAPAAQPSPAGYGDSEEPADDGSAAASGASPDPHQTLIGFGAPGVPEAEEEDWYADQLDLESIVPKRSRQRRTVGLIAAAVMVALGAAVPVAYYEGFLGGTGLGAPTSLGSEAASHETTVDAARAPMSSGTELTPTPSASALAPPLEEDAEPSASDDEPGADQSSVPASKPAESAVPTVTATAPQPPYRRPPPRSTKLPAVRDYGI